MFLVGMALLLLGSANWLMGRSKMKEYEAVLQNAIAIDGPSIAEPFRGTATILEPATDARFLYESASIKRDYYRVVKRGGRFLTVLGTILVLGAMLRRYLVPQR